eukprot:TRINITY_DN112487_c0_g1_i1.p1 TRINITY_DN112487_c0_g1~~TRINITY_DN112487_c0_g1_i1.p1  ORF type:complete len:302 (+),score=47.40 TRINITY_DN112487_c0_g1_i1:85-906(+)
MSSSPERRARSRTFALSQVLQQMKAAMKAGRHIDGKRIHGSRSLFQAIDKERKGELSRDQIAHGLKRLDVVADPIVFDMLIQSMIENYNGLIEAKEFERAMDPSSVTSTKVPTSPTSLVSEDGRAVSATQNSSPPAPSPRVTPRSTISATGPASAGYPTYVTTHPGQRLVNVGYIGSVHQPQTIPGAWPYPALPWNAMPPAGAPPPYSSSTTSAHLRGRLPSNAESAKQLQTYAAATSTPPSDSESLEDLPSPPRRKKKSCNDFTCCAPVCCY